MQGPKPTVHYVAMHEPGYAFHAYERDDETRRIGQDFIQSPAPERASR